MPSFRELVAQDRGKSQGEKAFTLLREVVRPRRRKTDNPIQAALFELSGPTVKRAETPLGRAVQQLIKPQATKANLDTVGGKMLAVLQMALINPTLVRSERLSKFYQAIDAFIAPKPTLFQAADRALQRYLDERAFKKEAIAAQTENVIGQSKATMQQLAKRLQAREISLDDFARGMRTAIRRAHLAATIIGAGGIGNISSEHIESTTREIARQFKYLDGFLADIKQDRENGKGITARSINRAGLYAQAARSTQRQAERLLVQNEMGSDSEERRVLGPAESTCAGCAAQAAEGWSPIGTLDPIGSQECGPNCKCSFEYRTGDAAAYESEDVNMQAPI